MNYVLNLFFNSDSDVMSNRAKEILSNAEDRKKYLEAIEKIREFEKTGI